MCHSFYTDFMDHAQCCFDLLHSLRLSIWASETRFITKTYLINIIYSQWFSPFLHIPTISTSSSSPIFPSPPPNSLSPSLDIIFKTYNDVCLNIFWLIMYQCYLCQYFISFILFIVQTTISRLHQHLIAFFLCSILVQTYLIENQKRVENQQTGWFFCQRQERNIIHSYNMNNM